MVRRPSWPRVMSCRCDRVLVRCKKPYKAKQHFYKMIGLRYSDHKPVTAYYTIATRKINYKKRMDVIKDIYDVNFRLSPWLPISQRPRMKKSTLRSSRRARSNSRKTMLPLPRSIPLAGLILSPMMRKREASKVEGEVIAMPSTRKIHFDAMN